MKRLILFDIDGTLISSGGAGVISLNRAFNHLFGVENAFEGISMAGKTDMEIIKQGLDRHGFSPADGNLEAMKKMYLKFLVKEIENPNRHVKPGIREVLDQLNAGAATLGLLTGNLEEGARIKLEPFGLADYFLDGAFGSDHEDRDMLLPVALRRFAGRELVFSPKDCIVIGDTPRDVRCAKIHGARCVAVATGPYSREALLKTDADVVLDSFSEAEKDVDFLKEFF